MNLTNHQGLPQALVEAVRNDGYSKGEADFSVTELLQPPQKVQLERRHDASLSEDAADRIWSLMGQVAHGILERAGDELNALTERRLFADVGVGRGSVRVSGAFDRTLLLNDQGAARLQDYKVTTAYAIAIEGGVKPEWEQQINIYAALLRHHGYTVDSAEIVAILRDWSKMEAKRRPSEYPQQQVMVLPVRLWAPEEAEQFLTSRAIQHAKAADLGHLDLPPCTDEERWAKPGQVAVYKQGNKRAARVVQTLQEAVDWMAWRGIIAEPDKHEAEVELSHGKTHAGHYVEFRPPRYIRCENYCAAAPICHQWATTKRALGMDEQEAA